MTMTRPLMQAVFALALLVLSAVSASAQAACELYRVQRGDTLNKIVERVDGLESYRQLYRVNRRAIGRNPNIVRLGTMIRIPCVGPAQNIEPLANAPAEISFLTSNGLAPYADEALAGNGMFTRLVERAVLRAAPDTQTEIVFVNDRGAHMDVLLPRGGFDAGFPWTAQDCAGSDAAATCDGYRFSEPFYEIVDGFFSRNGDGFENVFDPVGFANTTICRPEGHSVAGMKAFRQQHAAATVVTAASAEDCFNQLMFGQADIVAVETRVGTQTLALLGLQDRVVENKHLFEIHPLRVAVPADNPNANDIIEVLNRGLKAMLQSGEWDSIISDSLMKSGPTMANQRSRNS